MVPLVKPSQVLQAVCAYWLTSSEVSEAKAQAQDASKMDSNRGALVGSFPMVGIYIILGRISVASYLATPNNRRTVH